MHRSAFIRLNTFVILNTFVRPDDDNINNNSNVIRIPDNLGCMMTMTEI